MELEVSSFPVPIIIASGHPNARAGEEFFPRLIRIEFYSAPELVDFKGLMLAKKLGNFDIIFAPFNKTPSGKECRYAASSLCHAIRTVTEFLPS